MRTFTALYESREDAERTQAELTRLGIIDVDGETNIHDRDTADFSDAGLTTATSRRGFFAGLRDLFVSEEDSHTYAEGVKRGHFLLTVKTDEANADRVQAVLEGSNAVDVDEKAATWRREGWAGPAAAAATATATPTGETHIPIVEEQLIVGKREVARGGVRVRSYVRETPVTEQVTLREEQVHIERRPVDGTVRTAGLDADPFQERSVEVTATAEEAVVGKAARVVEEVVVTKDVDQHVETISDTVRRTEVDVDRLGDKTRR